MKKYLIIGNGVAGATAVSEIHKNDPACEITVITEEGTPFYSRIRLPDFVAGRTDISSLIIQKDKWFQERNIDLKTGITIKDIDPSNNQVIDLDNNVTIYDTLLLATGSSPFIPPIKGNAKMNVFALRNFEDAKNIIRAADKSGKAVVIGGGLLGLEVAHALIIKGIAVTVVEFFDRLLPRQMDTKGARMLKKMLENQGFKFEMGATTKEIKGDQAVTGVELASGKILEADLVIFSAGVRPNIELPSKAGIAIDRGVIVNSHMETNFKSIYAAGDIAQFEDINFCIWPEAQEQGRIAGLNMVSTQEIFESIVPSNRLKVAGIEFGSAGDIDPENVLESEIVQSDKIYRKLVKKNEKLVGCIMLGTTTGFFDAVKQISKNKIKEDKS